MHCNRGFVCLDFCRSTAARPGSFTRIQKKTHASFAGGNTAAATYRDIRINLYLVSLYSRRSVLPTLVRTNRVKIAYSSLADSNCRRIFYLIFDRKPAALFLEHAEYVFDSYIFIRTYVVVVHNEHDDSLLRAFLFACPPRA